MFNTFNIAVYVPTPEADNKTKNNFYVNVQFIIDNIFTKNLMTVVKEFIALTGIKNNNQKALSVNLLLIIVQTAIILLLCYYKSAYTIKHLFLTS